MAFVNCLICFCTEYNGVQNLNVGPSSMLALVQFSEDEAVDLADLLESRSDIASALEVFPPQATPPNTILHGCVYVDDLPYG